MPPKHWRGVRITECERRQLKVIRNEINRDFTTRNAPSNGRNHHRSPNPFIQQPPDLTPARPGIPSGRKNFILLRRSPAQGNGRASAYPAIEKVRIGSSPCEKTIAANHWAIYC
jgi:hypothetical protein